MGAWLRTLLLLSACAARPPDEAIYAEIMSTAQVDWERDLPRCLGIRDPDLQGDCALVLAQRYAEARGEDPETWCVALPEGVWQDECLFQAAEAWERRGGDQRAAELCASASRFAEDCAQHLWQTRLSALIARQGAALLPQRLPQATALYDRWEPHMGQSDEFPIRFWRRYYEMGFETEREPDLSVCDPLPPRHRAFCRLAAGHVWVRRLQSRLMSPQGRSAFCSLPSPTLAQITPLMPGIGARPDPFLDALVLEQHQMVCQGQRLEERGGLVGLDAWSAASEVQ